MVELPPKIVYACIVPVLLILIIVGTYPLAYAVWISLHQYNLMIGTMTFIGGGNYVMILTSTFFWGNTMLITALYGVGSLSSSLVIGLILALAASEKIRGLRFFRAVLTLPILMAPISVGYLFRYLFEPNIGLVNWILSSVGLPRSLWGTSSATSLLTVTLVDIWQWTPFMFLVLLAGLNSLPIEPFEAAEVDGASRWQKFRNITLPMLKPVMILAIILRLMDNLKYLDVIYAVTEGGPSQSSETLVYWIFRQFFTYFRVSDALTACILVLIIVNVIATIFIRQIRRK